MFDYNRSILVIDDATAVVVGTLMLCAKHANKKPSSVWVATRARRALQSPSFMECVKRNRSPDKEDKKGISNSLELLSSTCSSSMCAYVRMLDKLGFFSSSAASSWYILLVALVNKLPGSLVVFSLWITICQNMTSAQSTYYQNRTSLRFLVIIPTV